MQQWIFTEQMLANTPSLQDKTTKSCVEERLLRAKAARFINECGYDLQIPTYTIATACVYMHRFYTRRSFSEYNQYDIGATVLFIACKTEESFRATRDVVMAVARVASKNPELKLREEDKLYQRWLQMILRTELIVLETLCFELYVDHPYLYLQSYVPEIRRMGVVREEETLEHLAFAFINDSFKSVACLMYYPSTIATACIVLALKCLKRQSDEQRVLEYSQESPEHIAYLTKLILGLYDIADVRHMLEGLFLLELIRNKANRIVAGRDEQQEALDEVQLKVNGDGHKQQESEAEEGELSEEGEIS